MFIAVLFITGKKERKDLEIILLLTNIKWITVVYSHTAVPQSSKSELASLRASTWMNPNYNTV